MQELLRIEAARWLNALCVWHRGHEPHTWPINQSGAAVGIQRAANSSNDSGGTAPDAVQIAEAPSRYCRPDGSNRTGCGHEKCVSGWDRGDACRERFGTLAAKRKNTHRVRSQH